MYEYQNSVEEWRTIEEFPDYSVISLGRVRSDRFDRILNPARSNNHSLYVGLQKNLRQYKRYLPLLVAEAFVTEATGDFYALNYDTPMHKNGDQMDCRADNLIWATRPQAVLHHRHHGNR